MRGKKNAGAWRRGQHPYFFFPFAIQRQTVSNFPVYKVGTGKMGQLTGRAGDTNLSPLSASG